MLVLGITGKRACGKNLFAEHLREKHRFRILDNTKDVLVPILRKQGKPVTRENLTELAMGLRRRYGDDVLSRRLCKNTKRDRNMVVSNIRFPKEVYYLRRTFSRFKLIALEADPRLRYERARKRGVKGEKKLSFRDFMKLESLPTERVIPRTMELADFIIANNKTPQDLCRKIDSLMEKLNI